jgi:hypothetical protein
MRLLRPLCSLSVFVLLAACGGDDEKACNPVAGTGCDAGLVCEHLEAGGGVCAPPVVVRGTVTSLADGEPIEGARVVAVDANRAPTSTVAVTGADGAFAIRVANPRTQDRLPVAHEVFLRADARGHRTFPSGLRHSLPVSTADATLDGGVFVVENAQTEVALDLLPSAGSAAIHGVAQVPPGQPGVLVVAEPEAGGAAAGTAIADRDGDYAIFNLAPGNYAVRAYARGAIHPPAAVTLVADEDERVDLAVSAVASATVSGGVQLVNPGDGTGTSVILVVESTFNEGLGLGEAPPGLRVPDGLALTLKGTYSIAGVPPGRYVALAAFEDDLLVRDPDVCIGGTQTTRFEVAAGATSVPLPGFKVTGALNLLSPGADGPEVVSGTPVFSWEDDSGEDAYDIAVVDGLGEPVWNATIPGVSGATPSLAYAGPALAPGYYQWSVKSSAGTCNGNTSVKYLSRSEDLKGVFVVE